MLNQDAAASSPTAPDRESRVQALLEQLRPQTEAALRQMAERLVDLPEEQSFGQIEYDLRDLAHHMAGSAHQAGLQAGKKRAMSAPPLSAPTVPPTPASSNTARKPG